MTNLGLFDVKHLYLIGLIFRSVNYIFKTYFTSKGIRDFVCCITPAKACKSLLEPTFVCVFGSDFVSGKNSYC